MADRLMRQSITSCALAAVAAVAVAVPLPSLVAAPAQSSNTPGHLVFGVVRNDGLLLPFAAFDGRKWSTPWPDGIGGPASPDLPVNLASVPVKWWGGEVPAGLESLATRFRQRQPHFAAVAGDDPRRLEPPAWLPDRPAAAAAAGSALRAAVSENRRRRRRDRAARAHSHPSARCRCSGRRSPRCCGRRPTRPRNARSAC